MSKREENAPGPGCKPEALRSRVEAAAVQLVLGNLGDEERIAFLKETGAEAEASGRADIAAIAAEALAAVSGKSGAGAGDRLFSDALARMQQSLAGISTAPHRGESVCAPDASKPAAPAIPPTDASADAAAAPAAGGSLGDDRELVTEFILECRDHLTQVEVEMITLEKRPEDAEAINTVFRAFHTIKGLAGFLDLGDIREIAHETESLLDLARNHKQAITAPVVDVVLAAADFLKGWLKRLETTLAGGDAGAAPEKRMLLEKIRGVAGGPTDAAESVTEPPAQAFSAAAEPDRRKTSGEGWTGPERRTGEERRAQSAEASYVKVDTAKLDFLVDMAGEMVIAQSMLSHHPELAALHSPAMLHSLAHLARITGDLQKTAMSMRMVPIGGLFQKMNRLVRDLARKTGKDAELESSGGETELDRNVVEELADPLMHMVRNAIDHGLETAEERLRAGKNAVGHVRLSASHKAGHILIEIADDGKGLNRERILEKAQRMGLIEGDAGLSDREIFNLIFHPGFSTAAEVTDVSGRGVGMDVVRRNIQKLRGHINIESTPGKGTAFSMRLPLTLAIIEGLVVGTGRERYVVPIFSVREMLRPTPEMLFSIEGRQEMALVRDNLLPVVRLYKRFGVKPRSEQATESLLIVAEAAGISFCLMVDELIGKQEVVIKSLGENLKDIPGVAGGAILGDGRVGLILDLEGIFRGGIQGAIE